MAILTVGTGQEFATIHDAIAAAQNGDDVQVQAGTYTNDFSRIAAKITVEGVGGIVHLVATTPPADLKSIMTVDASATIRNLDFSGAAVADADGGNGAGIRYEGGDLVVDHCSFHDNQNGLMGGAVAGGTITVTNSVFDHNGSGTGYTHNIYVGDIAKFTATNDVFEHALVGHELKSRAETDIIANNTFLDGPTGTASYDIDLPNGGNALIQGNTIEKGPDAQNNVMVHFGGEGIAYAGSQLTITGNNFVNDKAGGVTAALKNDTLVTASVTGNSFTGNAYAALSVGLATLTSNTGADGAALKNSNVVDLPGGGQTIYIHDALAHTITMPGEFMALVGGAGMLTATGLSHETVVGGAGGLTWTGQNGADCITTAANSRNAVKLGWANNSVDSEGADLIVGSSANDTVMVNGRATVEASSGNSSYTVNGTVLLHGHGGSDTIALGAQANATISESTFVNLSSAGANFTLTRLMKGASVADSVTVRGAAVGLKAYDASGINMTVAGGSKGSEIDFGSGRATIRDQGAPDTIRAGACALTAILSGSAQVYEGSNTLSVFGSSISGLATIHGGTGLTNIGGDTGNIVYLAEGSARSTVNAGLAHVTIKGGAGQLTINTTAGLQSITGGAGGIVVNDGYCGEDITTLAGSRNTINLGGTDAVHSHGSDTISVGWDWSRIDVSGSALIHGGKGAALIDNEGAATVQAGSGNTTLTGGGRLLFQGSTGASALSLGQGAATIQAGAGDTTVTVGTGHEVFAFAAGVAHGTTMIFGFNTALDQVQLTGYAAHSAKASTIAGGSMLTLADGTKVEFMGLTKAPTV